MATGVTTLAGVLQRRSPEHSKTRVSPGIQAGFSSPTYGVLGSIKSCAGAASVLGRLTALLLMSLPESAAKQYPSA